MLAVAGKAGELIAAYGSPRGSFSGRRPPPDNAVPAFTATVIASPRYCCSHSCRCPA